MSNTPPECDPHSDGYASDEVLQCYIGKDAKEEEDKNETGWPLNPNLPAPDEIDNIYNLIGGYTELYFPIIPYKKLLTTPEEIDQIHGEIIESEKRWSESLHVRAFIEPDPITQAGTRYGIEESRAVDLLIAVPDLLSAVLATQNPVDFDITLIARIGDKFWFHKREYVVTAIVPAAFWANTDIPLYYHVQSELQRDSAVNTWGP